MDLIQTIDIKGQSLLIFDQFSRSKNYGNFQNVLLYPLNYSFFVFHRDNLKREYNFSWWNFYIQIVSFLEKWFNSHCSVFSIPDLQVGRNW